MKFNWNKYVLFIIALIVLTGLGLYMNNIVRIFQAVSMPEPGTLTQISQAELEEQYGLRVNLVAVTAMGGLVDLRFKIVDGEKAKAFLQDANHFPSLWISNSGARLTVPEETKSQEIQFEDDGNLFLMFPNARGIVKPGTPVTVRFGETQLEPIPAK
jgi:hypothetical protein